MTNLNKPNPFQLFEYLLNVRDKHINYNSKALLVGLYAYANNMSQKQDTNNLTPYPALIQRLTGLSSSSIFRAKNDLAIAKLIKTEVKYVKQSPALLKFLKVKKTKVKPQTKFSLLNFGQLPLCLIEKNNLYAKQLIAVFRNKQKPANASAAYYFLQNYYNHFGLDTNIILKTTELVLITALTAICDAQGWIRPFQVRINDILDVASISRSQFFISKKILSDLGLVCFDSNGRGTYSIYLSDAVINSKDNLLTFGTDIQAVDNFQKAENLKDRETIQSTTEITSMPIGNFHKSTKKPSIPTFYSESNKSYDQSITGKSINQGVNTNKGLLLFQQNSTLRKDLQEEIKRADELNKRREHYLTNKIKINLQKLVVPKQYWPLFTRAILVKIYRRLNNLGYHLHTLLEKGDYMGILPLRKRYRINNYDAYIQSILTQWKCVGYRDSLGLLNL